MSFLGTRPTRMLALAAAVSLTAGALVGCLDATQETNDPAAGTTEPTSAESSPTLPAAAAGPECPEDSCITMAVTGDLLLHHGLWDNFATDPAAHDGQHFNFEPLLAGQRPYLENSDIGVCHAETPVAEKGGPYADYPDFQVPPEILTAVKSVG